MGIRVGIAANPAPATKASDPPALEKSSAGVSRFGVSSIAGLRFQLTEYEPSWFGEQSMRSPSNKGINFACVPAQLPLDADEQFCPRPTSPARHLYTQGVPMPAIFPTPDGGIQAEWVLGVWAADATFSPDGHWIAAEATNSKTRNDVEAQFSSVEVSRDDASPLAEWLLSLQ